MNILLLSKIILRKGESNMTQASGYTINVNPEQKVIDISVVGSFTPEQAVAFQKDYQAKIGSISAKDFTLRIDCKHMHVITQEMIPKLEISLNLYKQSGFKEIQVLTMQSAIIKMQVNRMIRNTGLTNAVIIEH